MSRPIFSGHETFRCKTHWLKRGYDFICNDGNFNAEDAVVRLGVGKNMVSSIKYWMKAFGFIDPTNTVTNIAGYLLNDEYGKDPFFEDIGTLWLLHFTLIHEDHATIYKKTFIDFHRQRNEIEKVKLQNYIKATCFEGALINQYNESTIKKDVDVLLHNYCGISKDNIEEQNTLLLPLNLIRVGAEKETWIFNYINQNSIPAEIFLYAIIKTKEVKSRSVPFEMLQRLSLIFCMDNNGLVEIIERACSLYPSEVVFSDNAGIKELQFRRDFNETEVLDSYYRQ